jgi:hypothetical protein
VLRAYPTPEAHSVQPEEDLPEGEFYTVYLSSDVMSEMRATRVSVEDQALYFGRLVSTADSAPPGRSLDANGARAFFARVAQGDAQVVGFAEFAYSNHGRLQGDDRLVEREYWIKLKGDKVRVILHVHYLGRWSPFLNRRDRSLISAANLRHAVPRHNPAGVPVFPAPCKALGLWREMRKLKVDLGPGGPWDWRGDRSRHPALHDLLADAERCARRVRSLAPGALLRARRAGARHALIVAVDDYPPPVPRLGNPVRDGCNLEAALLELGWEVPPPPRRLRSRLCRSVSTRGLGLPGWC